jgi:hypothetical protein
MSFLDSVTGVLGGALKAVSGPINPLVDVFESIGKELGIPPQILDAVELVAGAATGNLALAAAGAGDLLSSLGNNPSAKTEYVNSSFINIDNLTIIIGGSGQQNRDACHGDAPCPGYAAPPPPRNEAKETAKSNEESYRDALRTFNNHWREVRNAAGPLSPGLTHSTLERIAKDPTASAELKEAAKFFLDHPELFDKLDVGEHGGDPDGFADKDDLDAALRRANESTPDRTEQPSLFPSVSCMAVEEAKDQLRAILGNKSMPMEAKIMLFASAITSKLDKSIDKQLSVVAEQVKKQEAAGSNEGKQAAASGSLQLEMQKLNLIMQLEKTMVEVASNAIANYNQMNSKITGNLRA